MSTGSKLTWLLVEKQKLQCVFRPLKSNRVKYTCFEVSHNLLILGATSGGLYLFRRDPCVFLQLIPNKFHFTHGASICWVLFHALETMMPCNQKGEENLVYVVSKLSTQSGRLFLQEGPVNNIALSFDEKLIAFSSLKGVTCVLEIQDGESRIINRSLEHVGNLITSLVWSKETNKLYLGDDIGRLSVINVSLFLNKNIFNIPAYMFMKLDSAIVQISCYEEYLLISTKTRCYMCDTSKEQYKQIGNQLREGFYGATFVECGNRFKVYCARPGSRLWEVDDSGNVISTHQFKKALAVQSSAVVKLEENALILKACNTWPDQSFNFCSLLSFLDRYLLTFKSDGIYVFDPTTAEVILWSDYYKDIVMIKSVHDIIYVWNSHGQLYSFVVTQLSKCLIQLYFLGKYQLCIDVLEAFLDQAMSDNVISKVGCLVGLQEQFPDIYRNTNVYGFIEKLITGTKDKQLYSNLDSGIFLIDNKHWKKWKIGVKSNKSSRKKKISRSHSMSDISKMYKKNVNSNNRFSYVSLPDIHFSLNDNISSKSQNFPDDFVLNYCHSYVSSSFMHQIPFLSLTSPDIIQSTIVELGHNVKRKLFNSTKSLQNKLHIIEEKIKFHKGIVDSEVLYVDFKHSNSDINGEIVFHRSDGNIVHNQSHNENSKMSFFGTDEICQMCEKLNTTFNEEDTFILFNLLTQKLVEHNQSITSNENIKKSFPFKQMLVKHIDIIRHLFCRSLQSGWIIKYIDHFKAFNDKYIEWQEHPLILQEIHKTEDLIIDNVMSNILLMFSEILDPYSVLQCLENLKLACTFFSCSLVLDIFQETSFNFFASKKDLTYNYLDCPLPYLLNMLFLMLRLDQVESACHIAIKGNLKLHYISYLILKLTMHLEFTGINYQNCIDRCNKLFLNFLLKLKDNKLLSLVSFYDKETLFHIENAFFSVNKHLIPKCICNYPLIGSAKYSVKCPEIGKLLLKRNLSFFQVVNPSESFRNSQYTLKQQDLKKSFYEEKSLSCGYLNNDELPDCSLKNDFCINNLIIGSRTDGTERHFIYSKIISLLQTMPDLITSVLNYNLHNINLCLPFIIQFGKINVLDDIIESGSYEFWNEAFELNLKLSNGFCVICKRNSDIAIEVDWNQLSVLTLRSLGAMETNKLIMGYSSAISPNDIDIRFFRACFLSNIIQRENENGSALIDVYCNQPSFTASRISVKESEVIRAADILRNTENTAPHSVTVDFKNELCCYCSLPLTSDKVKHHGKIRLFKCDHIYHISCLKQVKCDFECPLCR